jgi:hypothetical protein
MHRPERLFYFELAALLHMPVKRMLRELDSRELTEWIAFFRIRAGVAKDPQQTQTPDEMATILKQWAEKVNAKPERIKVPEGMRPEDVY